MKTLNAIAVLFAMYSFTVPIEAGVTVTSFKAGAGTNAFAPLDQSKYYVEQFVENVSPALATASGDWTGPNFGGTADTWHWVGSARSSFTTTFDSSNLGILGSGSFSRQMTTTADFVSPANQAVLYGPGSGANYVCFFKVDSSSAFALSATLVENCSMSVYSFTQNQTVYSKRNNTSQPLFANQTGVLPPGEYSVGAGTGMAGTVSQGASDDLATGSFTNFNFTVSVPEPSLLGATGLAGLFLRRRR